MFTKVEGFMSDMATLDPEVKESELKKFSATERANIKATEYIAADSYPQKHIDRSLYKLAMNFKGKTYYPIVGWNPDLASPYAPEGKIPPMRKWLNTLPQHKLHNSKEDRTYIFYG